MKEAALHVLNTVRRSEQQTEHVFLKERIGWDITNPVGYGGGKGVALREEGIGWEEIEFLKPETQDSECPGSWARSIAPRARTGAVDGNDDSTFDNAAVWQHYLEARGTRGAGQGVQTYEMGAGIREKRSLEW